ncbi:WhiB family transcriptional regulator [Micromonospora chersina]|uniref:WhiB family transcriptional regulator n=1 Tax=Micromonospora chersina TaxID=47854 RepID=UPI0037BA75F0
MTSTGHGQSVTLPSFLGKPGRACADVDPELFFPLSENAGPAIEEAKAICNSCAWTAECLSYALATRQMFGVWGGTSSRERFKILTGRKRTMSARTIGPNQVASQQSHGWRNGYSTEERAEQKTKALALLQKGATVAEIARALGLSRMTTKKRIDEARREVTQAPAA